MRQRSSVLGALQPLVSEVRAGGHAAQGTEHEMLGNLAELITDKQPAVLLAELKASLQRAFLDAEAFKLKFEPYMEMVLENRLVTLETMDMQVLCRFSAPVAILLVPRGPQRRAHRLSSWSSRLEPHRRWRPLQGSAAAY
jgi:hypothetical protein